MINTLILLPGPQLTMNKICLFRSKMYANEAWKLKHIKKINNNERKNIPHTHYFFSSIFPKRMSSTLQITLISFQSVQVIRSLEFNKHYANLVQVNFRLFSRMSKSPKVFSLVSSFSRDACCHRHEQRMIFANSKHGELNGESNSNNND